jgi:hypothetical protein
MSHLTSIRITLEYKLVDCDKWKSIILSPENYFDLESDELVGLNSLPFYNHAIDLITHDFSIQKESILATKIHLLDEASKQERFITESFWNYGRNRLIERSDRGDVPYTEIILEMLVSEVPEVWEILRCDRLSGILTPSYHAKIQEHENGAQTESQIHLGLKVELNPLSQVA